MNIYLSSSWKNRKRVRALATALRASGHDVYDFTDANSRGGVQEIPPEKFPENFDPENHKYAEYLKSFPEWKTSVMCNKRALAKCNIVVLMLPAGNDAHADAYYALGLGKYLIVCGQPRKDERTPTHLWAQAFVDTDEDVLKHLEGRSEAIRTGDVVLHRPTGESWLVAYVEEDQKHLAPCGYPFCLAPVSDCVVLERASDDQSFELLLSMSNMSGHDARDDFRRKYARRVLGLDP